MKLEEILTPQMIFKPDSFYDGGWNLGWDSIETQKDLLYLNSKIVNNKNLYIEFLNKYYFKSLSEMLKITSLESFYPSIVFDVDKKLGERSLKFSLFTFISEQIFTLLNQENIDELLNLHNKEITDEELIEFVKEKNKRR